MASQDDVAGMIKRARLELGLSQKALADAAGISPTTVMHIETGQVIPRGLTLFRLAKPLKLDPTPLVEAVEGATA